jgi:hypothetical protein
MQQASSKPAAAQWQRTPTVQPARAALRTCSHFMFWFSMYVSMLLMLFRMLRSSPKPGVSCTRYTQMMRSSSSFQVTVLHRDSGAFWNTSAGVLEPSCTCGHARRGVAGVWERCGSGGWGKHLGCQVADGGVLQSLGACLPVQACCHACPSLLARAGWHRVKLASFRVPASVVLAAVPCSEQMLFGKQHPCTQVWTGAPTFSCSPGVDSRVLMSVVLPRPESPTTRTLMNFLRQIL